MTSSIFDPGQASNWGTLTYNTDGVATTTVKARTSNSSSMTGATGFSSCNAITSGSDISSNNCVTDTHRYIQYQISLTSVSANTPTFQDVSIAFTASDTTPPSISLTALSPDPNNDNTQSLSGSATDAIGTVSNVQFQMDSTSGSWTVCTANDGSFNSATETFSCTVSLALSDGSHTIYVRATDSNGNTTAAGSYASDSFTIDATAPTISVTVLADPNTDSTPTLAGTASDATTALTAIQFQVDSTLGVWSSCSADDGSTDETSETFTCTTSALADGLHTLYIRATDKATNSTSSLNYGSDSFTIDTTAPSLSLTAISPDPGTDTTPTLAGRVTDATGTISTVQFQVDSTSGTWSNCTAADGSFNASSENFSCTTSTLPDGSHTIYVRATDNASNSSSHASDSFTIDTTAPASFNLDSPGDNSYTNSQRPSFRWQATTDATAGLSKYVLAIDNPSIGSGQPSGDFTIDSIPTSRTSDYETNKYIVHYENFADSDLTNNYISVYTKSHSDWGTAENDGKVREGRVAWTVKAVDNAGNETASARTLLVDTTSPKVEFTQVNDRPLFTSALSTRDKTPIIYGKITDPLAGGDPSQTQDENGPKIASAPQQVEIKIEKKAGSTYELVTLSTINLDKPRYSCDNTEVSDNAQQKCDKYWPFEYTSTENLKLGTYKITLTGKDKADNTSSETTLTLNITPLTRITTPEEVETIEEEIKELPKEEPEKVKEVAIIKSVEPSDLEQAGNIMSAVFNGIGQGVRFIVDTTGKALALVGNRARQALALVGQGLGNGAKAVGQGYNNLANNSPGVAKNIMLAVGDGLSATGNFIGTAIIKIGYLFVPQPTKIYDVQVVALSSTSAKISWQTNHPANGKVNYGLTADYGQDVQSEKRITHHEFTVTGLKPKTTYHYEVMSQNRNYVYDANHTFTTPAK